MRSSFRVFVLMLAAIPMACQPASSPNQPASKPSSSPGTPSSAANGEPPMPPPSLYISAVALSPDGKRALTCYRTERFHGDAADSRLLSLWDTDTSKELWTAKGPGSVRAIAFCPDGKHALALGARDGQLLDVWDLDRGRIIQSMRSRAAQDLSCLAVSPDGKLGLTGGAHGRLEAWDLSTGKPVRAFGPKNCMCKSVAFSPRGDLALTALNPGFNAEDPWLLLWHMPSCRLAHAFSGTTRLGNGPVGFSPDGRLAVSPKWTDKITGQNPLVVWQVPNGRPVRSIEAHVVQALAFGKDSRSVVAAYVPPPGKVPLLCRWDIANGRPLWSQDLAEGWTAVTFSPDGRLCLLARDSATFGWNAGQRPRLLLWDTETGRRLREWSAPYWLKQPPTIPVAGLGGGTHQVPVS